MDIPIKPDSVPEGEFFSLPRKKRDVLGLSRTTNAVLTVLLGVLCIVTLIPLYIIVISSVTSEAALTANGYRLWPEEFSIMAYKFLFSKGSIVVTAYKNTVISTLAGTVLSVLMVGLYAYPLSRPNFKFKAFFTFFAFFTMLFGGGLVSYYMVTRQILQIQNSI
ncbi:MAG: carbohydrate ABC transporter permease, partial [Anaerolineae bacterium]|nr:carbohydrate ABC transporter permease [Anaerolineae bacterium]